MTQKRTWILGAVAALGFVGGVAVTLIAKKNSLGNPSSSCFFDTDSRTSDAPFFSLNDKTVTDSDIPADLRKDLIQIQREMYERKADIANRAALRIILAKEKGKEAENLSLAQLMGDAWVKEEDVRKFYEANKKNLPANMTLQQLLPSLQRHLETQKTIDLVHTKVDSMRKDGKFKRLFHPPCGRTEKLDLANVPNRGVDKSNKSVAFVSSYSCNLCRSVYLSLESKLPSWEEKFKFSFIPIAAANDELGAELVRGAQCAYETDAKKFWNYNHEAFLVPIRATQNMTPRAIVLDTAKRASFEEGKFRTCLEKKPKELLEKSSTLRDSLAFADAPFIFINNKELALQGNDRVLEFLDGI